MAIFQPSYISPDVRGGVGAGVTDATQDLSVSWKINGQSALTSFSITIYLNDVESTQKYTTGQITTGCPAYGTTNTGEPQFFSYTIASAELAAAGIVNGEEYKLIIKQWWSADDSVTQASASVFVTRSTPTLSINTIGTSGAIDTKHYTFRGSYTQAQGDALNWFRWQIADTDDNIILDSGNVSGTMDISCYFDGFFPGVAYQIRLSCQTENGAETSTGWVQFSVNYPVSPATGEVSATCAGDTDAVVVDWSGVSVGAGVVGFALYRRQDGAAALTKVADVPVAITQIYDYGAVNQRGSYAYYLFQYTADDFSTTPIQSDAVSPCWWNWTLMECETTGENEVYTVIRAFRFRYNIETGAISNNNAPNVMPNFTPYPTVQIAPQNYKTGSLAGLIGTVRGGSGQPKYIDTVALRDAIYALSTSGKTLFLKSRKGEMICVKIAGAITMQTADATREQTQTMTLPWVEVGNADGVGLYSLQSAQIKVNNA